MSSFVLLHIKDNLMKLLPGGSGGFTAKSSASTTTTAATSATATFSNTFQNFVGQNYASQLDGGGASDLPVLSSPEIPRGKKRQAKWVFSPFVLLGSRFLGKVQIPLDGTCRRPHRGPGLPQKSRRPGTRPGLNNLVLSKTPTSLI